MRRLIAAGTIILSAILLFAGLGHYALWDDEAVTALAADGVWRTGDTSVILGHNIVAYRSGLLLKGTHERSTPPLGAYLTAPFLGLFGHSALVARLPFAFIGLLSVGMMLWWLHTIDAKWVTWLLLGLAVIGNVSFQLYSRQCRYYSPAIFSSIVVAYLYLYWNGSRWQLVLMAAAGLVLLASNYLNFLALHICMLIDYLFIGRKRKCLTWKDWLIILLPQIILGGIIVTIWNTLGTGNKEYLVGNSLSQRLMLVWMNLRDINYCEYGAGLVMLAAPLLYVVKRDIWLLRAPLVLVGYVVVVSLLSPQLLAEGPQDADVRYLAPIIPLCIAIEILVLVHLARVHNALAIGFAVILFGSNLVHGAWLFRAPTPFPSPLRSTLVARIGELISPPPDPYRAAAEWIQSNLKSDESVWVLPDYSTYPLLFHAPNVIYAWQLNDPPPDAFKGISPIYIKRRSLPDYIIAFGPTLQAVSGELPTGAGYQLHAVLDVFWHDLYRPELFWRQFKAMPVDRNKGEAIYILKRQVQGLRL